jgi:hypothetical protein
MNNNDEAVAKLRKNIQMAIDGNGCAEINLPLPFPHLFKTVAHPKATKARRRIFLCASVSP